MCIFHVSFSLLEEGTYSAFTLFAKTKYFLAPPQTPFANKSFPDACYLQSAPALGNRMPYRPNPKESVPEGAMSGAPPSESPVLGAVQLHSRCVLRGMLGRWKCSSCAQGSVVQRDRCWCGAGWQGSCKSGPGEAGLQALKGQLPFAGVKPPLLLPGSVCDLRAATHLLGQVLAAAVRASSSGPCHCMAQFFPWG